MENEDDCNTIVTRKKKKQKSSSTNTIGCDGDGDGDGVTLTSNSIVELPDDITPMILSKLDPIDFYRFDAACKSWRSISIAARKSKGFTLRYPLPWLMFSSIKDHHLRFFTLDEASGNNNNKVLKFDTHCYSACVGSNWGWLIMANYSGQIFLFNPFTKVKIQFPDQAFLPDYDPDGEVEPPPIVPVDNPSRCNLINKAMLLSPPVPYIPSAIKSPYSPCVLIAIYANHKLAFSNSRSGRFSFWTGLGINIKDVILYDGLVYAITDQCDLKFMKYPPPPKPVRFAHSLKLFVQYDPRPKLTSCNIAPPLDLDLQRVNSIYLVESVGDLLMVIKSSTLTIQVKEEEESEELYEKYTIQIFKLDLKARSWTNVEDLADQMLFVGISTSLSVSARHRPGFRGNCIYFSQHDDQDVFMTEISSGSQAMLYRLEDKSFEFLPSDELDELGLSRCPSIWFTPIV